MSERTGTQISTRYLRPEEVLSEEEACATRQHPLFPDAWETANGELSRTYQRARARLRKVFIGPLLTQSLLVQTPGGLAAVWRIWYGSAPLQVVRVVSQSDQSVTFEPGVVSIPENQLSDCEFIVDRIMTELPPWSH